MLSLCPLVNEKERDAEALEGRLRFPRISQVRGKTREESAIQHVLINSEEKKIYSGYSYFLICAYVSLQRRPCKAPLDQVLFDSFM